MYVEITGRGIAIRNVSWQVINDEAFRNKLETVALPLVEFRLGLQLEGVQEYDHICQVLRVEFADERLLPSSKMEEAEALSKHLTDEVLRDCVSRA
jgi:hypothetical protein